MPLEGFTLTDATSLGENNNTINGDSERLAGVCPKISKIPPMP